MLWWMVMMDVKVLNCDGIKVNYHYYNEKDFVKNIDSEKENIPMLDDKIIGIKTDIADIKKLYKEFYIITVDDLYNFCKK